MKITLLENEWKEKDTFEKIFFNRGMTPDKLKNYLNFSDKDINSYFLFGKKLLEKAAKILFQHIQSQDDILIVVDSDCDGYTSAAILINYLNRLFPSFVENHLKYIFHLGKQHGLSDCIEEAKKYKLVICPDSSSNDIEFHKTLHDLNIDVLVLDHHDAEVNPQDYPYAIIINNQLSDYPNKEMSGAGVVWQFCRYLDFLKEKSLANDFLDLVALGNCGDMESMLESETKWLIFEGFKKERIKNPFIFEISNKNTFSLSKSDYQPSENNGLAFSPIGAAFFIVPFVNAINRSGTLEEKKLIFDSMLERTAFNLVLSNKRGHREGEKERVIDQALRTCTNVKNRQTKAVDAGMALLEDKIEKEKLLEHKALVFLLEPGQIDPNIAGLAANKIMSKYQRPVCVLTKVIGEDGRVSYQGSARGCDTVGVTDFKKICAEAGALYAEGHPGAFGLGLGYDYPDAEEVNREWLFHFYDKSDEILKDMPSEPCYYVDYSWDYKEIKPNIILAISELNDYIGRNFERPYIYITDIPVSNDNFMVMKSNTLKYSLPSVNIIQFGGTEEEIDRFKNSQVTYINAICKCCANEWMGRVSPQLQMIDYEVIKKEVTEEQNVLISWGF